MGRSKANVLKNGNVEYHSQMLNLYFVTERQYYTYKGKHCNRLVCFVLGKGKHRKANHRLRKVSKFEYDTELEEAKRQEACIRRKKEENRLRNLEEENL